ncbi:DUF488 family protein [Patescibacteria group bacterium]|nr:DUF488 family protein [Patescibacteria group bacterium]
MDIRVKRVYEPPEESDGRRILVDRLWPRGLTKQKAKVDLWLKDLGPSTPLRQWFNHEPAKWDEFQKRYREELKGKKDLLNRIPRDEKVTLIYGARDKLHNEALVLKNFLTKH